MISAARWTSQPRPTDVLVESMMWTRPGSTDRAAAVATLNVELRVPAMWTEITAS